MGDETKMVGANSKLYLRGKIGDCKRRRPNSALLESSDMLDESVDISTSFRQIIRQSAQRQLTAVTNGSEKLNRPEQTSRLITYGSKKHFRCSKLDAERFYNCDELTSPCFLTHYNKSDVEELILNKTDSTVCIGNSNNPKNSVNKLKTGGSFDNMNFKKQDFPEGKINVDNHDSEQDRSEEDETVEIKKQKEKKDNENCRSSIYSSSNKTITEKLGRTLYQTKIANSTKYASLVYENRKSRDVFKARSTNIISESVDVTPNRKRKLEDKIALGDSENFNDITKNEINNGNEINYFKYAPLTENVSFLLLQPSPDILNDNNQIQEHYENQLSRSNNSLCSEISSLSSSCYKISVEDDKDFCNNESKASLEEVNQKNALNLTINPSLINFISREQEGDIANSQSDKQYQLFSDVNSNGCGIKCSPRLSPYNITTVCTELNNATSTYAKSSFNLKLEDISFEYDTTENVLITENIEFKKKSDNKQEQENICFVSKPNALQNINSKQTHLNSDPCLENNLKEAASVMNDQVSQRNCTLKKEEQHLNSKKNEPETKEQHFIKYVGGSSSQKQEDGFDEAQPSDRTASHQQLEKDIINAAKNVYTQIEEQYYQHQHVLPLSSGYERVTNSKQHPHHPGQQDHDEHHQRHDINLSLQQNHPPQHHSILQQQPYSDIQLYQVQQQDQHQDDQIQKQIELQQHHHSTSRRYQRESGQHHHSHLMDFLHSQHHHHSTTDMQSALHQQQHQIHEVYNDLMMDEFHDEHHTPYKLGLSPSTVKHENQDDGYETSAGDVLTPNSHISSTHSVTPQHHIQHGASDGGYTTNITKCNEKQHQSQQYNIHLQQHSRQLLKDQNMQQELTLNEPVRNPTPRDIYFIDDDLNSRSNNNSFRNILTPRLGTQEAGTINNFLLVQSDATSNVLSTASDMHGSTNSTLNHLFQKKVDIGLMSTTVINMDYEQYHVKVTGADIIVHDQDSVLNLRTKPIQKRRGRKKKIAEAVVLPTLERTNLNNVNSTAGYIKTKERKKHDRFNGMSQEEIVKRILPDHLCDNLDIVIIGINPGLFAAYKGHHYAGPGNHFWKCLYLSGLIQEQMNADEDFKLIKYGIGFTNMVQRVTKGSADLTRKEIKEGSRILLEKLQRFRPKIAVFNGKLIFEVFSGKKDFNFGRQPECVEGTDTFIWVMPSSSARCAQLPRAADKVPFYAALKKFRDYLNGIIPHIDQSECVFTEERIKQMCEQQNYKNQQNNVSGSTVDTFSDAIGIRNSYISLHSNTFDSKPNPHGAGGGTGPPSTSAEDNNVSTSFMMSSLIGPQCEKKKRGRPKKMKYQEIIDPVTGNKREYSNILNLSVTQASNNIMPKKSRGRPKKVKLPTNTLQLDVAQSSPMLSQKSSILSIYAMTSDIIQDHMQRIQPSHQHASLYSTPPPTTMVSPMASPSLNCSYTTNTPSQPNHDKSILTSNERESSKTTIEVLSSHHSINDQNFCESLSPNSPNICAVDFDPPTAFAATSSFLVSDNVNSDVNIVRQQRLRNSQKSPYSSPNNDEATHHNTNTEHFHQWLSPHRNYNVHSPAAATIASHSLQQASLNYQDQQQDTHARWPLRHQSRCNDNPYLLYSLHQTHSHQNESHNHQAQQLSGNDVARKSLCGLESLVDQIPTISESESIVLLSAAVENRLVTTLAPTIESRLQKMQNSFHNDTQNADCSHFSTITRPSNLLTADNSPASSASTNQMQRSNTATSLLNNNFSVSNLAASSLSSNNNNNNQPNYCLPSDPTTLTNTNPHRHSNLMAAAVLAAAVNSPSNLSAPAASSPVAHHAQIYMDPHTHLTSHVPINPIYSTAAQSHHHHTAVAAHHHHRAAAGAAVHYTSAQHSATDYATVNNPCVSSQSNVTGNTLHMPSPNYPYGYSTTSTQSNYSAYPHTYADHHHGHPHAHHTTHHLDLFDRSKPSNITGYSGGF